MNRIGIFDLYLGSRKNKIGWFGVEGKWEKIRMVFGIMVWVFFVLRR